MSQKLSIGLVIVVVLVVAGVLLLQKPKQNTPIEVGSVGEMPQEQVTPTQEVVTPAAPVVSQQDSVKTYTLAEVANHATIQDCWSVINGTVYDLTPWIAKHPGGQKAIASLCGIDGSARFNGQHVGQARPQSELDGFAIGKLAQ